MTNFKDFFKSMESKSKALAQSNSSKLAVTTAISNILSTGLAANSISGLPSNSIAGVTIANKKQIASEKFSNDVSELVHSDDFLEEFSQNIGTPQENESEDEFVNRAKEAMRALLRKKLSN